MSDFAERYEGAKNKSFLKIRDIRIPLTGD